MCVFVLCSWRLNARDEVLTRRSSGRNDALGHASCSGRDTTSGSPLVVETPLISGPISTFYVLPRSGVACVREDVRLCCGRVRICESIVSEAVAGGSVLPSSAGPRSP